MKSEIVYTDSVIEVAIVSGDENPALKSIAIRYLKPENYIGKNGNEMLVNNIMGGETDWFILPHTFGAVTGKKLFEQRNAGLDGFQEKGYKEVVKWLIEMEIIDDAMCY